MPTPRVFYDGPSGNLTSWNTKNFTVCMSETEGCDTKYSSDAKSVEKFVPDFCRFHMFYAGLNAMSVYCQSDTVNRLCSITGANIMCKPFL